MQTRRLAASSEGLNSSLA